MFDSPFAEYVERQVTITPGGGNAKTPTQPFISIDPWPPYAGNARIPGQGRKAVSAVERMIRGPNAFRGNGAGTTGTGTGIDTGPQ